MKKILCRLFDEVLRFSDCLKVEIISSLDHNTFVGLAKKSGALYKHLIPWLTIERSHLALFISIPKRYDAFLGRRTFTAQHSRGLDRQGSTATQDIKEMFGAAFWLR